MSYADELGRVGTAIDQELAGLKDDVVEWAGKVTVLTKTLAERDRDVADLETRLAAVPKPQRVVLAGRGSDLDLGMATAAGMAKVLGSKVGNDATWSRTGVAADRTGNLIRQKLPAGTYGVQGNTSGIAAWVPLPERLTEATLTLAVRFDDGFDFGKAGKLPGLGGASPGKGSPPTGGRVSEWGFSDRIMWLARSAGFGAEKPLDLELAGYVYDQRGGTDGYGRNERTRYVPATGRWFTIDNTVRLNTVGQADGLLRIAVDGQVVLERTDMVWGKHEDTQIDRIAWDIFRGGGDASYAVKTDGFVSLHHFEVTTPA